MGNKNDTRKYLWSGQSNHVRKWVYLNLNPCWIGSTNWNKGVFSSHHHIRYKPYSKSERTEGWWWCLFRWWFRSTTTLTWRFIDSDRQILDKKTKCNNTRHGTFISYIYSVRNFFCYSRELSLFLFVFWNL